MLKSLILCYIFAIFCGNKLPFPDWPDIHNLKCFCLHYSTLEKMVVYAERQLDILTWIWNNFLIFKIKLVGSLNTLRTSSLLATSVYVCFSIFWNRLVLHPEPLKAGRQSVRQSSLSPLKQKSVCFPGESHSSVSFPFPALFSQSKQSLHSPVPTYSSGLLKPDAQRLFKETGTVFCSSNVGSIWRYRAHVSDQIHFNQTLKPRHAIALASLSLT